MGSNNQIEPKTGTITITGISSDLLSIESEIRFTNNNKLVSHKISGRLLPLPQQLLDAYISWKQGYLAWGKTHRYWQNVPRAISIPSNPIETNVSIQNCDTLEENLIQEFNHWLYTSPGLSQIRENLLANITPQQYKNRSELLSFVVQIRTNDSQLNLDLQRLPWNEWKFIQDHYNIGIALSTNTAPIIDRQQSKLKAIVICGKYNQPDNQIDLQPDLDALQEHLSEAVELEIWISDPADRSKLELLEKLDGETYHLLFFCGHSSSNNQIQLNDEYLVTTIATIALLGCSQIPMIREWISPSICEFANDTPNISCGEKILLSQPGGKSSDNKIEGFNLIQEGLNNPLLYQKAIEFLEKDWKSNHDPETSIAIENAKISLEVAHNSTAKIKNIAIVVPAKTSTPSYVADSMLKGIAYLQQQHNRNPNRNWKLRILIADDSNDRDRAQEIAIKLVNRQDILGIIGHYSSQVTVSIVNDKHIYNDKIVLISPTATSHKLTNNNNKTFFFRVVPSTTTSAKQMVEKWVNSDRRIVLFYQQSGEFSRSLTTMFKQEISKTYPDKNIIIREVDLSNSDNIKDEIDRAKQAGANAIALFPDAYTSDTKTNSKFEEVMNYNNGILPILANTCIYDLYDYNSQSKSTIIRPQIYKNVTITIPWDYSNSRARYQGLVLKDNPKQLPDIPKWWLSDNQPIDRLNERTVMAYDAALVLLKALNKAEDRLGIQKVLADSDFRAEGVSGMIHFEGSDRKEQINSLITPNCDNNQCDGFRPYSNK